MTRGRSVIGLVLALLLAGAGVSACGGGHTDRDEKVCRSCVAGADHGCFNECRELCAAGDPDCDSRCTAQCDECRRDLVCSVCRAGCSGTTLRCAPQNETVDCDDGTFGGEAP